MSLMPTACIVKPSKNVPCVMLSWTPDAEHHNCYAQRPGAQLPAAASLILEPSKGVQV